MAKRLTENHPLYQKVEKLEKFMHELGITLDYDGYHLNITDNETGVVVCYRDKEGGEDISSFPYFAETKLVID